MRDFGGRYGWRGQCALYMDRITKTLTNLRNIIPELMALLALSALDLKSIPNMLYVFIQQLFLPSVYNVITFLFA